MFTHRVMHANSYAINKKHFTKSTHIHIILYNLSASISCLSSLCTAPTLSVISYKPKQSAHPHDFAPHSLVLHLIQLQDQDLLHLNLFASFLFSSLKPSLPTSFASFHPSKPFLLAFQYSFFLVLPVSSV